MNWFLDGTKLLISGNVTTGEENRAVFVASTVTGNLRLIREGAGFAAVSPDGSRIAYKNLQQNEMWLMGVNGENPQRLLAAEPGYWFERMVWSSDGKRMAFMRSRRALDEVVIETLEFESGRRTVLLSDHRIRDFCWAPEGRSEEHTSELQSR